MGILEHEGGEGDTLEQGVRGYEQQLQESVSRKASEGKKLRK